MCAALACELKAIIRRYDVSCIDQVGMRIEIVRSVQEELSPFRKIQGECRVDIKLGYISLDLRKVRVYGSIQIEILIYPPPNI